MTTLRAYLHPAPMQDQPKALSPFGYLLSSLGGLVTGVGVALLIWHVI